MFYLFLGKIRKVPSKIELPNNKKVKEALYLDKKRANDLIIF